MRVPTGPGRSLALVAVLALAVAVVVGRIVAAEPAVTAGARGADAEATSLEPPTGRLVYADWGGRLWTWDLVTGTVTRGTRLRGNAIALVDASGAGRGWIGVETRGLGGSLTASVLEDVSTGRPRRLATGDVVAWGPSGVSVVVARNGPPDADCPKAEIVVVAVRTGSSASGLSPRSLCGPIEALGRSPAATYATGTSDEGFGLHVTGTVGVPHLLFGGVHLIASSPVSAFLLEPEGRTPRTLLRWRGSGGPVRFELEGEPLMVTRVLAWSVDALHAAVIGVVGDRTGVYLLDVSPGQGPRAPVFITGVLGGLATFASNDSMLLSAGGRVFRYEDRTFEQVSLPAGVPAPSGPILWMP